MKSKMKEFSMQTQICILFGFALSVLVSPMMIFPAQAAGENPFVEGTQSVQLSAEERATLLEFASSSKRTLEKALEDAKGKSFGRANELYLRAIKSVVLASNRLQTRSELLMRIALNQGLELTFGIPNASGMGVLRPGVLDQIQNAEVKTVILEDSIKLAIRYYENDRQALESGTLEKLPYVQFAFARAELLQSWVAMLPERKAQFLLLRAGIRHFLASTLNEQQLHRALYAEEITQMDEALKATLGEDEAASVKQVRALRNLLVKVTKSGSLKLQAQQSESQRLANEETQRQKAARAAKAGVSYVINPQSTGEVMCTWNGEEFGNFTHCSVDGICGDRGKILEFCTAKFEVRRRAESFGLSYEVHDALKFLTRCQRQGNPFGDWRNCKEDGTCGDYDRILAVCDSLYYSRR